MVEAFSQNSVTLTGLPMILVSESDMTYPLCGVSCYVLLAPQGGFSLTWYHIVYRFDDVKKNLIDNDCHHQKGGECECMYT